MTARRVLDRAGFVALFLVAGYVGRQALLPGTDLAVVWPAAGVAAAWFAVTGWQRSLVVDVGLLLAAAWLVNDLTGASTALALGLAAGIVVQVLVLGLLLGRWCPGTWGSGDGPPPVLGLRDLGRLMAAAFVSALVSALVGPASALLTTDSSWTVVISWVLRNATGVVAIFPLALLVRGLLTSSGARRMPVAFGPHRGTVAEAVGLVAVTAVTWWLVLVVNDDLPVPFLLLATCVWAGTRFSSWIAALHALVLCGAVAAATVSGHGPFVAIADDDARALVVQAYVAMVVALNLALSVGRGESLLLHQRLAASEGRATAQATMVRAILDSMADGVTVVDRDGRLVLRNPAAAELVGEPHLDVAGRLDAAATVSAGFFRTDGTPLAPDELPLTRALAGESVRHADLLVRNPGVHDGRTIEVTATPLPHTDPPTAVVVFHDVTAARRERDELASFAGVVAHDLLNPLTVVEGWSEALLEAARAGVVVPPERQVEQLDRIQRAAQRMQHLISDLLAFTTARDLRINPVHVDLSAVAHDVARARIDANRVRDLPEPVITVDPNLPPVLAEPVLLRQVVDNLIGNAIKYVAPGVRPEIEVRAERVPGDERPMVRLDISDNGIGIPTGQHTRVFDTFHRAHQDGYRGTGLGLSIVKRIAERHGGTADARDNADRPGTTMSVTFPAADPGPDRAGG